MLFLINELSYVGQAQDIYSADELMREFWKIIQEIQPIQRDDPLLKHSSLSTRNLCPDLSLIEWLRQKLKSSNSEDRTIASFLIRIINKFPFIDEYLEPSKCYFNKLDVTDSALAGAAFLNGILISLKDSTEFSNEYLNVEFGDNVQNLQEIQVHNLFTIQQARRLCPRYNPNYKKHDLLGAWQDASIMDLNDEEAQEALNNSIEDGTRRYSYYKRKYYEFKSESESGNFNELGYPTYHGYEIKDSEIPHKVLKKLLNKT